MRLHPGVVAAAVVVFVAIAALVASLVFLMHLLSGIDVLLEVIARSLEESSTS